MIIFAFSIDIKMINALSYRLIKSDTVYVTVASKKNKRIINRNYIRRKCTVCIRLITVTDSKCLSLGINGIKPGAFIINDCKCNCIIIVVKFADHR